MSHLNRVKFGIERRLFNYSALVRSGQMERQEALERVKTTYSIEDPKIISLCIKRLGLTQEEFDQIVSVPPKTFRDYPSSYQFIRLMRIPIWIACKMSLLPGSAYDKYFNCGK
jgi:hypothetical protein